MPLTQTDRLMSIKTPLPPNMFGEDALILNGFTGPEAISQLFRYDCDLLGEGDPIAFEDIIGQRVTIQLVLASDEIRYFNGFISSFVHLKSERGINHYRAEMVPWLWFLTRSASCRIFPIPHQQAVPGESEPDDTTKIVKIIERVFKEFGFTDYRFHEDINLPFDPREFCVQYRETAFNFVSRLLEQYGIFYYFEHEQDKHTLVLGHTPAAHQTIGGVDLHFVHYEPTSRMLEHDAITHMEFGKHIRAGKFTHRDFNFSMNKTARHLNHSGETTQYPLGGNERYEIYDYPAEVGNRAQIDALGKIRMEEEQAQHYRIGGKSTCRLFSSGYSFSLLDYVPASFDDTYLLTSVRHEGSMGNTYIADGGGGGEGYANTFTCMPLTIPFRPAQRTPKPVVQGPQTAIVVGPDGEEIWCDEYGRIKVQFHWDRDGQYDEESSCFVRVSQIWAGKQWGAQFIPRIGHEVIIEFLGGDPDRPMVTGCLYNAENKPPYPLPDEQTKSGIKSCSTKPGEGSNEIRFEDKKGEEQLFLHAERQQENRVEKDSLEWVGQDRHLIIMQDQREEVHGDKHLTVHGDQNQKIDGTLSLETGSDLQEKVGGNHGVEASEIHLKGSTNVIIEAGASITLKAGGGFVVVGPSGVTISGTPVLINSGGSAGSGSGCTVQSPALPMEGEPSIVPPPTTAPPSPAAQVLQQAARDGTPFCEQCEAARQAEAEGSS